MLGVGETPSPELPRRTVKIAGCLVVSFALAGIPASSLLHLRRKGWEAAVRSLAAGAASFGGKEEKETANGGRAGSLSQGETAFSFPFGRLPRFPRFLMSAFSGCVVFLLDVSLRARPFTCSFYLPRPTDRFPSQTVLRASFARPSQFGAWTPAYISFVHFRFLRKNVSADFFQFCIP